MNIEPLTIAGRWVRLEPLALRHAAGLAAVADDAEIWRYLSSGLLGTEQFEAWIAEAQAQQEAGTALPFAIIERAAGRVVGSTRYLNIMRKDRGLEIGWTWLARSVWRTAVNSECKYLLLRHAFERLGGMRVQLKTDARNERSRRAIERIGGQFEGVLRKHMVVHDGIRDSAMYSIVDDEWPIVKARLEAGLYGAEAGSAQ